MSALLYTEEYGSLERDDLVKVACQLRNELEQERKRSNSLAESLKLAKEQSLAAQKQVEQEEEYITNKLMKRLEQLKREKQALATEVEQEEEMITNTLQKKLEKLNRDKVALENQLEAEQEYITHRLQKQVAQLAGEKAALQRERSELQRQVGDLIGAVDRLNRDKVALEQSMEAEEENIVNRLQRQLEAVLGNYRTLESRLEAKGLSLRDVGVQPSEMPLETWGAYSRSTSRASSGELSRSWGSSRGFGASPAPGGAATGSVDSVGKGSGLFAARRERPFSSGSSGLQPAAAAAAAVAASAAAASAAAGAAAAGAAAAAGQVQQQAAGAGAGPGVQVQKQPVAPVAGAPVLQKQPSSAAE